MPITKSARKALRQSFKRHAQNLKRAKELKEALKAFKKNPASAALDRVYQTLDKAAKINVIKKNKAARLKSRLSGLLRSKN